MVAPGERMKEPSCFTCKKTPRVENPCTSGCAAKSFPKQGQTARFLVIHANAAAWLGLQRAVERVQKGPVPASVLGAAQGALESNGSCAPEVGNHRGCGFGGGEQAGGGSGLCWKVSVGPGARWRLPLAHRVTLFCHACVGAGFVLWLKCPLGSASVCLRRDKHLACVMRSACRELGTLRCPCPAPGMPYAPLRSLLWDTSERDFLAVSLRRVPGTFAGFRRAPAVPRAGSELAQNQFALAGPSRLRGNACHDGNRRK